MVLYVALFAEVFEDTMGEWMAEFHKYLAYENAALAEPDKPSIVDQARQIRSSHVLLLFSSCPSPLAGSPTPSPRPGEARRV